LYVSESLIQQFLKTIYLMYSLWIHYIWFLWNNYFITSGRFSASWKIAPDKELGNRRRKHHRGHAIAIVNAYLLHSHDCKTRGLTPLSFHNFKLKLIAELVGPKLRSQLPAAAPQMEPVAAKAKLNPFQGHDLANLKHCTALEHLFRASVSQKTPLIIHEMLWSWRSSSYALHCKVRKERWQMLE
jgi:hypothetical protein